MSAQRKPQARNWGQAALTPQSRRQPRRHQPLMQTQVQVRHQPASPEQYVASSQKKRIQRMWGRLFLCTEPRSAPLSGGSGRERLPEGWPGGLPLPELLSAADAKEADDISELLGPYVAAALYSRHWQLREAALQQLVAFLGKQVSLSLTLHGWLTFTVPSVSAIRTDCWHMCRVQTSNRL